MDKRGLTLAVVVVFALAAEIAFIGRSLQRSAVQVTVMEKREIPRLSYLRPVPPAPVHGTPTVVEPTTEPTESALPAEETGVPSIPEPEEGGGTLETPAPSPEPEPKPPEEG